MNSFIYNTPTKVIFGRGAETQIGELVKARGCSKVLLHYGSGSARRTGLLDRIEASLKHAGVRFVSLGGVVPNPRLSLVREGIRLCCEEGVDFLLAVGGGSVIDSAKAIGYGVACGGDVWDFYTGDRVPTACLPLGVVLTIAAAGSEMSNSSVITNEDGWSKRGCNNEICRAAFAVMNPELTMTLPAYQTASGCTDILMHTLERWFDQSEHMEITDGIAQALMRTVMKNAAILRDDPTNYDARAEIMWCSSLSHNGLTGCGGEGGDWSTHKLEHELGGMFDVAHGAGLAALWGSWARYVCSRRLDRFVKLALEVLDVPAGADDAQTAERGIVAMEDFFRSISMPTNLRELGVQPTDAQIAEMARKCKAAAHGLLGKVRPLDEEDMSAIYQAAR